MWSSNAQKILEVYFYFQKRAIYGNNLSGAFVDGETVETLQMVEFILKQTNGRFKLKQT